MKRRRPTSKQVAERAGVSQTTVSFVLNNVQDANISEETRERVLKAARELDYTPDSSARSLARGRSDNIALVLVQPHRQVFIDEYIPRVLTGVSEVTRRHGFRILLEQIDERSVSGVYQRLLYGKEAAGLIINFNIIGPQDIDHIVECARNGMPVVSLKNIHPEVHSVVVDKSSGVRTVVQHLIDLGYQRIACITYDDPQHSPHVAERFTVYQQTLEQNGLAIDPSIFGYGQYEPETGYKAMQRILDNPRLPDAVYAMNDLMAFGAVSAIHERGLRIPEDIAIVGFDDVRLAAFCSPPLTTMNEPDEEHGRRAAEMLIALLNGQTIEEKHITLQTHLVVRESCGASFKKK